MEDICNKLSKLTLKKNFKYPFCRYCNELVYPDYCGYYNDTENVVICMGCYSGCPESETTL